MFDVFLVLSPTREDGRLLVTARLDYTTILVGLGLAGRSDRPMSRQVGRA